MSSCLQVQITVISSWVLGHGPCGPGCSETDLNSATHQRRLDLLQTAPHGPYDPWPPLGQWEKEIRFEQVTDFFA